MDCQQMLDLMGEAVLSELRGSEAADFYHHLRRCPACRQRLAEHQEVLSLTTAGAKVQAPSALADRILAPARAELASVRPGRRPRRVLAAASAAAAAAAVLLAAGWLRDRPAAQAAPQPCACWRFVAGDAGNSRQIGPAAAGVPERVLWKHQLEGAPGAYKPLAWKDLVIVGTVPAGPGRHSGGGLVALQAEGGAVRWRREFPAGDFFKAKGFPDRCVHKGRLFLTDGRQCLVLDPATGGLLQRLAPPAGADGWNFLAADASHLYGAAADGRTVFCLDADTGREIWSHRPGGAVFLPALCDGRLYAHTDTGALVGLDAATGRQLWRHEAAGPPARASVHAHGQWIMVVHRTDDVAAFHADGGRFAWRRRVPGAFASGVALGEQAVYTRGGSAALGLADGRVLWRHGEWTSGICSAPTLTGGQVVSTGGPRPGSLSILSGAGETLASVSGVSPEACDGAIVSERRLYVVGGGQLLALACRSGG